MTVQERCLHDQPFVCFAPHSVDMPTAVWACTTRGCGYWLNFDPSDYLGSVALLNSPSPEIKWKRPPRLVDGIGP
jgi:hypothetical protein